MQSLDKGRNKKEKHLNWKILMNIFCLFEDRFNIHKIFSQIFEALFLEQELNTPYCKWVCLISWLLVLKLQVRVLHYLISVRTLVHTCWSHCGHQLLSCWQVWNTAVRLLGQVSSTYPWYIKYVTEHKMFALVSNQSIQFWSGFILVNRSGQIYPTLTTISPTPTLHLAQFMTSFFSLQTNTLALLLHLRLPHLLWSSLLPLARHFKLQHISQNMPIIPTQHMPVPSHSICL